MVQLLGKAVWRFLKKLEIAAHGPAIPCPRAGVLEK